MAEYGSLQNKCIAGLPDTGRTSYTIDLILQDIKRGVPVIVFDGYGDMSDKIISSLSSAELSSLAYIDVGNKDYPVGLNIFEFTTDDDKKEVCNFVIELMYDLYDPKRTGIIGPRFEHAVRNAIMTIASQEHASFIELVRCLTDSDFVSKLLVNVKDPMVYNYWTKQIAQTSDFHKSEVLDYIVSKFGRFVTDTQVRNIIGQTASTIQFEKLLSEYNSILFDFRKLNFDKEAFRILSSLVMEKLIYHLRNHSEGKNNFLSLYVDEISLWPPSPLTDMLQNGSRMAVQVTYSTQRISQIDEILRKELFCCPTLVSFRVSTDDAKMYAAEFHSALTVEDLCLLPQFYAYRKQIENGVPLRAQLMNLTKSGKEMIEKKEQITSVKDQSGKQFGRPIKEIEAEIQQRMNQ